MHFANALKLDITTLDQTLLLSTFFLFFITFLFNKRRHVGSSVRNGKMLVMVLLSLCRSSFMPAKTAHGSITFLYTSCWRVSCFLEIYLLYI